MNSVSSTLGLLKSLVEGGKKWKEKKKKTGMKVEKRKRRQSVKHSSTTTQAAVLQGPIPNVSSVKMCKRNRVIHYFHH